MFISPDSFLHSSVYANLGEKVGIKRCIIGKGCFVGKGSKLTNAVIMEGVVIGEKYVVSPPCDPFCGAREGRGADETGCLVCSVKLDNCVVSNGVQIRDRATLKDCELGRDVIVDTDGQLPFCPSASCSPPTDSPDLFVPFAASIKNEQLVVEVD